MQKLLVSMLIVIAAHTSACTSADDSHANAPAPPIISPRTFVQQVFLPKVGEPFAAGTAFGVRVEEFPLVVLTAHHLFGPDGGVDRQIPPTGLAGFLEGVLYFESLDDPGAEPIGTDAGVITIPSASTLGMETGAGDIAAFWFDGEANAMAWLKLADAPPREGDAVWLAASVVNRPTSTLHQARVVAVTADAIEYRYDDAGIDITATSGAPILNSAGEVVALNVGAYVGDDGGMVGFGNPVDRFRDDLLRAMTEAMTAERR